MTSNRFGKSKSAYAFDGISNFIGCGTNSILGFSNSSQLSISVWVYPIPTSNGAVLSKYLNLDAGSSNYFLIVYGPDLIIAGNGTNSVTSTNSIITNKWNHIVITFDASHNIIRSYINGVAGNSGSLNFNTSIPATPFDIGRVEGPIPDYYAGSIDDVRVYNRILTSSEITYLAAH